MTREEAMLDRLVRRELRGMGYENANRSTGRQVRGARLPPLLPNPLRPPHPGSRCLPPRHRVLQDNVHNLCDAGTSCDGITNCMQISRNAVVNRECLYARRIINDECFGGGDAEHRREAAEVTRRIAKCREQWRGNNCDDWNRKRVAGGQRSRQFFD